MGLYIHLETTVATDPKLLAAGNDAFALYIRGLCWSKEQLTDGFIPHEILCVICARTRRRNDAIRALTLHKLWVEVAGGFTIPDNKWAKYQTTKAEVEAIRTANRARKTKERQRKREAESQVQNNTEHASEKNGEHAYSANKTQTTNPHNQENDVTMSRPSHSVTKKMSRTCHSVTSRARFSESTEHIDKVVSKGSSVVNTPEHNGRAPTILPIPGTDMTQVQIDDRRRMLREQAKRSKEQSP